MNLIGNLTDTRCFFTFSHKEKVYALCESEDMDSCVCLPMKWHPWHGYRYSDAQASEDAVRIAEQILALSARSPERYRMEGEHYAVSVDESGERRRYRIRKEKKLSASVCVCAVPFILHFLLAVLAGVFAVCSLFSVAAGWLSFLFPYASKGSLYTAVIAVEAIGVLLIFFLYRESRDAISLYYNAYIPVGAVILVGMLFRWKWLWILVLLLAAAAVFGLVRLFAAPRRFFREKLKYGAYVFKNIMLACVFVCIVCTISFNLYPYTYASEPADGADMDEAAVKERYFAACGELADPHFSALTPQEKLDILQAVCDYECIVGFGCNSARLYAGVIEEKHTLAYYTNTDESITIDVSHLQNGETEALVNTLLHETRHHYQYRVIALYEAVKPNLEEDYLNMSPFREARAFLINFQDYQSIETDGFDAYYNQLVESDSRDFAKKRMDEYYDLLIYQ